MRWNRRRLLRACEKTLARLDCTLRLRTIRDRVTTAHGTFEILDGKTTKIVLTADPAKGGLIEAFLHEALHVVLHDFASHFDAILEEELIRALERDLWVKTIKQPDVTRWRRLIARKLAIDEAERRDRSRRARRR